MAHARQRGEAGQLNYIKLTSPHLFLISLHVDFRRFVLRPQPRGVYAGACQQLAPTFGSQPATDNHYLDEVPLLSVQPVNDAMGSVTHRNDHE